MKLWELVSVCRGRHREALISALSSGPWSSERDDVERFDELVESQDRERLDRMVPEALVEAVVARLDYQFSVVDSTLRIASADSRDILSAPEVGKRYGYSIIEEVLERGSATIASALEGEDSNSQE